VGDIVTTLGLGTSRFTETLVLPLDCHGPACVPALFMITYSDQSNVVPQHPALMTVLGNTVPRTEGILHQHESNSEYNTLAFPQISRWLLAKPTHLHNEQPSLSAQHARTSLFLSSTLSSLISHLPVKLRNKAHELI